MIPARRRRFTARGGRVGFRGSRTHGVAARTERETRAWNGLPAAITNASSGIYATYEYDILDRPTNIVWRTAAGNLLTRYSYAYNTASLITNRVIARAALPVMNAAYSYELLDRLTAEVTNGFSVATTYDLAGNRLVRGGITGSYATVNGVQTDRLAAYGPDSFTYDAAGNLTNAVRNGVTWSYIWNARYQLTEVSSNGIPVESYQYDALSRRVSTTTGGTTNYHVYDGNWQVLADLDADGHPLRTYTWAPGIDHLLAMTVYGPAATNTYSALTDHLGTVHAFADATGAIVESYDYDAWGNLLAIRDASGSPINNRQSTIGNRYLFQGREYSFATGLYHFRHRWYDPATGRWLSNDPIGISGGMNQYSVCQCNPICITDAAGTSGFMLFCRPWVVFLEEPPVAPRIALPRGAAPMPPEIPESLPAPTPSPQLEPPTIPSGWKPTDPLPPGWIPPRTPEWNWTRPASGESMRYKDLCPKPPKNGLKPEPPHADYHIRGQGKGWRIDENGNRELKPSVVPPSQMPSPSRPSRQPLFAGMHLGEEVALA